MRVEELINYGIVNIDKPPGPTSHQVSDFVQKILKIKKSGHSGTLDPQVTGSLVVALGRATRIVEVLLKGGKTYVGIMHLHKPVKEKEIKKIIKKFFTGKIKQTPPIKSAVKREEREREIYEFKIIEIENQDVLFEVSCQAGTYIRKLCLHPKTEILSKNGLITASDFYSNHQKVYSFDNLKITEKNPSAVQRISSPKKLVKITMSSGINFIVTPDHELLASRKEGYQMTEAQKLKEDDYLVKSLVFPNNSKDFIIADLLDENYLIQQEDIKNKCKRAFISKYGSIRATHKELKLDRKAFLAKSNYAITIHHIKLAGIYEQVKKNINTFKTQKGSVIRMDKLNEDFFYLLGLIASDGNNTKEKRTIRHTRIKFHNKNEELINQFLQTYKRLFPNIPISKKKFRENLIELDTSNSFLATVAASLGIKSPQKNSDLLPILNAGPRFIKSFLKGYFDGDGSAYYKKTPTNHKTKICLHAVNYKDALRLHQMLLKIDISNKIFYRPSNKIYEVAVENIAVEKKFIKEIGTNHPKKLEKFKKIMGLKYKGNINDHHYTGFHFKEEIKKNKSQLHKMGGNLSRILKSNIPITRGFYKRSSTIVKLPFLDNFVIEKIKFIEEVEGTDYVYDLTVPKTHNFLIETGFVSSNCHDLGRKLGVGAHMAELRRTRVGPYDESTMFTLQDLKDAFTLHQEGNDKFLKKIIQPIESAVKNIPKVYVSDSAITSLLHGRDLAIPGIKEMSEFTKDDLVALMTQDQQLIALGTAQMSTEEIEKKKKGIAVRTHKVFMPSSEI